MTASFDMIQPGTILAERYKMLRLLGSGGMGAVYEAENTWTTRRVAIKVLHPMFSSDTTSVGRFKGEAQAATRLSHPNIVDVLDMGADASTGALYIVQEFLRGRDLHAALEGRKTLLPHEAAEILVPVMGALAVAHEHDIIHRDLKPENIFLANVGSEVVPKLIDFGLSKIVGADEPIRRTVTGTIMGTPYYMSPEQARGDRAVDARTDIWAIGVVFFELFAGVVPYDGASANLIMFKILSGPPPRIETLVPDIAPAIAEILHRALEPDVAKRYQTMRAMMNDVVACPAFQAPTGKVGLGERFARSIDHRPPSNDPGTAPTQPADVAKQGTAEYGSGGIDGPGKSASVPPPPIDIAASTMVAAQGVDREIERSTFDSWQRRRGASLLERPRRGTWIAAGLLVVSGLVAGAVLFARRAPSETEATRVNVVSANQPASIPAPPRVVAPLPNVADGGATPTPVHVGLPTRPLHRRSHRRRESDPLAPAAPP